MSLVPQTPTPQFVMATDGTRIATYDVGDEGAPAVLAVHGFASSAQVNWFATGWVRELVRAGFRVVAVDQRGHGRSDKPHDSAAYTMQQLVADVATVLDTYLLDEVGLVGYSLGARVGWHAALGTEHRITRAVLGGIPDGQPLTRFRIDEATAFLDRGIEVQDRITHAYIEMAARTPTNDLAALVALVGGLQGGLQPDPSSPPQQPVLFATGSEDSILAASQRLAAVTPQGELFQIPGRNHFNAPTSRAFRDRALAFLERASDSSDSRPSHADRSTSAWRYGLAAVLLTLDESQRTVTDRPALEAILAARWAEWERCLQRTP
jgi:pimeloyl-ACP methyl ester carboxylesterase